MLLHQGEVSVLCRDVHSVLFCSAAELCWCGMNDGSRVLVLCILVAVMVCRIVWLPDGNNSHQVGVVSTQSLCEQTL
jgi:hypothetical protein